MIIGIGLQLSSGGTQFVIENGFMRIQMHELSLVSFPFFIFAFYNSLKKKPKYSKILAPWWRVFFAFLIDFSAILSLIGIPICFIALIIENNGYPQIWEIARELTPNENILYSLILIPSVLLAIALFGFTLHPKVVSPGALFTNITITTKVEKSNIKLAMNGALIYFQVAFPFIKHFSFRKKDKEQLEANVVLRNA